MSRGNDQHAQDDLMLPCQQSTCGHSPEEGIIKTERGHHGYSAARQACKEEMLKSPGHIP